MILLTNFNDLEKLNNLRYEELIKIPGIGPSKACELLAGIELGKRVSLKSPYLEAKKYTNASLIYDYYRPKLAYKKQEYFYGVYLDQSKHIIKDSLLFLGTLNQSLVHPRELFKEAYQISASAIICVHNHPSGGLIPSKEDIALTERLVEVGKILGIAIIDHIIITNVGYYSFFENNLIFK